MAGVTIIHCPLIILDLGSFQARDDQFGHEGGDRAAASGWATAGHDLRDTICYCGLAEKVCEFVARRRPGSGR